MTSKSRLVSHKPVVISSSWTEKTLALVSKRPVPFISSVKLISYNLRCDWPNTLQLGARWRSLSSGKKKKISFSCSAEAAKRCRSHEKANWLEYSEQSTHAHQHGKRWRYFSLGVLYQRLYRTERSVTLPC